VVHQKPGGGDGLVDEEGGKTPRKGKTFVAFHVFGSRRAEKRENREGRVTAPFPQGRSEWGKGKEGIGLCTLPL